MHLLQVTLKLLKTPLLKNNLQDYSSRRNAEHITETQTYAAT